MPRKIAVIDGNSLMHRAYHAVPPTMNAPDGTPTPIDDEGLLTAEGDDSLRGNR